MRPPENLTFTSPILIEQLALTAWGKLGQKADAEPHALICHALDTYTAAEALYEIFLGPEVRRELEEGLASLADSGLPPEEARQQVRSWIFFLCALHDLGKLSPAFQALRKDRAQVYIPEEFHRSLEGDWQKTRHERVTALHLKTWLDKRGAPWSAKYNIIDALGGHHGWLPDPKQADLVEGQAHNLGDERWEQARHRFIELVAEVLGLYAYTEGWRNTDLTPAAAIGLAGLTMVADWTASDETVLDGMPYPRRSAPSANELPGYLKNAQTWIHANLDRVNWVPWKPPAAPSFSTLFPKQKTSRPLQKAVARLLDGVSEPGILIAQAPTGEGKTKAGLLATTTLATLLDRRGAYLAFPDRSLARDVHAQANEVLETTGSRLRSHLLYAKDKNNPENDPTQFEVLLPQDVCLENPEVVGWSRRTFSVNRGIIFPFGTGTIDQLLKAAIRSKGVTMRLSSLSNKVLLLDEVHSYNAHMSVYLIRLLWWCGRMGVPVVMLSATLTDTQRGQCVQSWRDGARLGRGLLPDEEPIPADAQYPWKLTWVQAEGEPEVLPVELSKDNPRRDITRKSVRNDPDLIAEEVLHRLREGGCAAIIRNSPAAARKVYEALERRLKPFGEKAELLYTTGRRTDQRQRRESENTLHQLRGPESIGREAEGPELVIAVGTQVLEHGMDVDYDFMVTDPAPVDHLCQRLGRLHRHQGRFRPGPVVEPEVLVVESKVGRSGRTFPQGTAYIYHKSLLLATEGELAERSTISLPEDLPELVRSVYEDRSSLPEEYLTEVLSAERERERRIRLERAGARIQAIERLKNGRRIQPLTEDSHSNHNTRG
ncbi:CRISPR-associated helicase Cas3' [Nocardiopsis alba]|uniref:CRISPR-associated helicase Cas3' n=1 Tax=Nocardiopsis alba TaxID=53437 RepID=UPI0036729A96